MSNANQAPTYKSGKTSVTASDNSAPLAARATGLTFLSTLATEVSGGTVDLPCFPDIVFRIRKALSDPRTTPERTVTIVGAEPRLAARLLQTANSAAFNPQGKPVTDLRTAITRLGYQMVQSAAMAYAVQHMKEEESLKTIAHHLSDLWRQSITVASICQIIARKTKISPDEAFLTGLLHGIGRLYIMVRSVERASEFAKDADFMEMVAGWHAGIGKAVLENWGFAEPMADAVGDQGDLERKWHHEAELTDILIVGLVIAEALSLPAPRSVVTEGIPAFQSVGLNQIECAAAMKIAEAQLASLQQALGC